MNTALFFDFSVDKEKHRITVKREFAADLDMVWDAWTKAELLEQWWARFSALDAFTDDAGNINPDFDPSEWTNIFTPGATTATVQVTIQYKSLDTLEKVIQMGMKEGFAMALKQLDEYFATSTKTK